MRFCLLNDETFVLHSLVELRLILALRPRASSDKYRMIFFMIISRFLLKRLYHNILLLTDYGRICANNFFLMLLHLSGDANLHVNVSVELTGETFHSELMTMGSELFKNKSYWIEAQVCT